MFDTALQKVVATTQAQVIPTTEGQMRASIMASLTRQALVASQMRGHGQERVTPSSAQLPSVTR